MSDRIKKFDIEIKIQETLIGTIQGEGYWTGVLADFVRLYGCNIGCHFCDTGYAQKNTNKPSFENVNLYDLAKRLRSPNVVVTGGEPTLNKDLGLLLQVLKSCDKSIHIETAGLQYLEKELEDVWITLSPKMHLNRTAVVDELFWDYANELKIVVSDGNELNFYKHFIDNVLCPDCLISFQPEWSNKEKMIPVIMSWLKEYPKARLSLQSHKFANLP